MTSGPTGGETVAFGLGGGEIHVHAPDRTAAEKIVALFPDYRKEKADETARLYSIDVAYGDEGSGDGASGEGYRIHADGEERVTPDTVEMLTAVEGILARGLLEAASDRVHLHASGVEVEGGALLALGTRGAGKSSLALAWSVMGLPVLGDDVVFVDGAGRARPFRRLFKVDPRRLESHGIDPGSTPGWVEGSGEAWFDPRTAGGWSAGAVPVRAIVVLERREGAGERWRLTPLEPAEALNDLLASVVWTGRSGKASLDPLLALLDGCDAHRLSFASSVRAARALAERMATLATMTRMDMPPATGRRP